MVISGLEACVLSKGGGESGGGVRPERRRCLAYLHIIRSGAPSPLMLQ